MRVAFEQPEFSIDESTRIITSRFRLVNHSNETWKRDDGYSLGWQIFDPETGTFIAEGDWVSLKKDLAPAETEDVELELALPPEKGRYHIYISPIHAGSGWFYQQGASFLLVDAYVEHSRAKLLETAVTTLGAMRRTNFWRGIGKAFTLPFTSIWQNRSLIRSMVRRDILSRYRGSFGDVLWTVLNPLLLMATYFFVFGVVLVDPHTSRTEFALYFLAGMLPWLPFSEAAGRAPYVILEYRNFVKKLVFPVETLPVNQVFAALVTEAFTLSIFLVALLLIRAGIPATVLWLPVLLIPQLLFTLGVSWFLAALGVYMRDLSQIISFLLTLWFFITPICFPETKLPKASLVILGKNPIYTLVRGYRSIFLYNQPPEFHSLWKLWILSAVVCVGGYAWFHKLRKSFPDVV